MFVIVRSVLITHEPTALNTESKTSRVRPADQRYGAARRTREPRGLAQMQTGAQRALANTFVTARRYRPWPLASASRYQFIAPRSLRITFQRRLLRGSGVAPSLQQR